ncbi:unnamed protein product [Cylicocyclus nassatus]|uniref:Uncharacterized protein n=1 Tax=Cylicocyclus nassatus TaxID=53992 RepID=A0AA36GGT9_CYLNA|nr:unnamed protein product [Cylicocyclus nassatus]
MIITSECRPYSWEQEPLGGIVWWVQLSGGTMNKPPEFDEDLKKNIGTITYEVSKDAEPIKFMETTRDFVANLVKEPHHEDDATYNVLQQVMSGLLFFYSEYDEIMR